MALDYHCLGNVSLRACLLDLLIRGRDGAYVVEMHCLPFVVYVGSEGSVSAQPFIYIASVQTREGSAGV